MPKQVDHHERRESIAHALWRVVDQQGWPKATMREVAREAGVSLGQLQHYFSSRAEMLAFAMEFASEQTSHRVERGLKSLGHPPHPRDVLRLAITELLPLQPDSRATSRMNAAYVFEAMHDPSLREQVGVGLRDGRALVELLIRQAMSSGQIRPDCDPIIETNLVLALTGLAPLLELNVIEPHAARAAIDKHLERLFEPDVLDDGPFFHGTAATLRAGDLLTPGFRSNYRPDVVMNHVYFTALRDGAGLAAELAVELLGGSGVPHVYEVTPTGAFENDPNVTDKKFPGNPTRSFRTAEPLRVVREVTDWTRLTPEALQVWRDRLISKAPDERGEILN